MAMVIERKKRTRSAGEQEPGEGGCTSVGEPEPGEGGSTSNDAFIKVINKRGKKKKTDISISQPVSLHKSCSLSNINDVESMFDSSDSCILCGEDSAQSTSIQCRSCKHFYHLKCCDVKPEAFNSVKSVCELFGWRCEACRIIDTDTISVLKAEITELRDAIKLFQSAQTASTPPTALPSASSAPLPPNL